MQEVPEGRHGSFLPKCLQLATQPKSVLHQILHTDLQSKASVKPLHVSVKWLHLKGAWYQFSIWLIRTHCVWPQWPNPDNTEEVKLYPLQLRKWMNYKESHKDESILCLLNQAFKSDWPCVHLDIADVTSYILIMKPDTIVMKGPASALPLWSRVTQSRLQRCSSNCRGLLGVCLSLGGKISRMRPAQMIEVIMANWWRGLLAL